MSNKFSEFDTPEQRQQLIELEIRRYPATRKTRYHVKILDVNYYITTGTITIDPDIRYKRKGFDALLTLLEEKYPLRPRETFLQLETNSI
jgi:hypothetical protein